MGQDQGVKEVLGIIPARGGSKGIPGKNLVLLAGLPLIEYTLRAARAARSLTRVLVTTDDRQIADLVQSRGAAAPFLRPPELAADDTPMLPVVQQALQWLRDREGYAPEAVVVLQPTSPLRRAEHIDEAVKLMVERQADTVVSVMEVPHQFNPVSVMRLKAGRLVPYLEGPLILRRQDKPRVYARNGPAVLATRRQVIEAGSLYGRVVLPLVMSQADSVDIDGREDLLLAEYYLSRRKELE